MLRKNFRFYEEDSGAGTPGASTPAVPTPEVAQVVEHVEEAATQANEAAESTGEDGWKVVAEELRGLRGDMNRLMEKSAQAAQTPTPEVEIAPPQVTERTIRRNGRKVTRRG